MDLDPKVVMLAVILAGAGAYYGAKGTVKVVKKVSHGIVHVVTLGKK